MKRVQTELYTAKEIDIIDEFIATYFGSYESVFHEITSPDIHLDICIITPTPKRNYYTLVTMGMGAHRMNVPRELKNRQLDYAELLITLPSDWNLNSEDERWYWPIRWLKVLARLPIEQDSWLGFGHTVPGRSVFADNTNLCGFLITYPYHFGVSASVCRVSNKKSVRFYQIIPVYQDEINYKLEHGVVALEDLFPDEYFKVIDINRRSVLDI